MKKEIFGFEYDKKYEYENGFYLTSQLSRVSKLITHWELYKKIVNIPGEVLEFGVYKGASLIRFSTFREMLESQYSRKVIGFDSFGEFPLTQSTEDNEFIEKFINAGGNGISKEELEYALKEKGIFNFELVAGDILKTLPEYLEKNPELRISLLHIDVDVYEVTKEILELLFDRVEKDGVIILDDYNSVSGATIAINEFFENKKVETGIEYKIEKLPYYSVPSFVVK